MPRQETFLARYPRKLKIGVVAGVLAVLVAVWLGMGGSVPEQQHKKSVQTLIAASVSGVDSKEAIANPEQAPITQPETKTGNSVGAEAGANADTNDSSNRFMTPA